MARWDLDRGLYPLATAVVRVNYLPFVTIALLQAGLQTLPVVAGGPATDDPEAVAAAGPLVMLGVLAASLLQAALLYLALRTLMTGERAAERAFDWSRFWSFLWRLIVLGLVPAMVMLAAMAQAGGLLGVLSLAATVVVLGMFGTVLADASAGGDGAFGAALERGQRSFGRFVGWMIMGPVLASFALSLAIAAVMALLAAVGVIGAGEGEAAEPGAWVIGLVALLGALGGVYVAALTAAVLAKAWDEGAGRLSPSR